MKNYLKIAVFLAVFVNLRFAQAAETCNLRDGNVDDLVGVTDAAKNCDEVDKAATCTEHKIDPNAVRNMITNHMDRSMSAEFMEKTQKDFRDWDRYFKLNPFYSRFYHYDEAEKSRNQPPTPILNWINDKDFTTSPADADALKKSFIDHYVEFAKKMDCTPNIRTGYYVMELTPPSRVYTNKRYREQVDSDLAKMRADLKNPDVIRSINERVDTQNKNTPETFESCSNKVHDLREKTIIGYTFPPCAGNFKEYFANNQYKISPSSVKDIMASPQATELIACIKERTAKGAKINHVSISASSSSLNNTGDAAKKFCKKGFLELSEARAESAREVILPALFKDSAVDAATLEDKIQINATGSNGNGTSGPCVYENKNGKEVLIPKYATATGQKELEDSKYVSVQVTFDENTMGAVDKKSYYSAEVSCRRITLTCSPAAN